MSENTDARAPDDDYDVPEDAQVILKDFGSHLADVCDMYASKLAALTSLSEAQSIGAVGNTLINYGAVTSVMNRLENLEGAPSLERWRQVSDKAWRDALEFAKNHVNYREPSDG